MEKEDKENSAFIRNRMEKERKPSSEMENKTENPTTFRQYPINHV